MVCPFLKAEDLPTGHNISVNLEEGTLMDQDTGDLFPIEPYPKFLRDIMGASGLINYTKARMNSEVR
jgi:3-isopropylmalate dehydratase small subunit